MSINFSLLTVLLKKDTTLSTWMHNQRPLCTVSQIENIRDIFLKERDAYGSPEVSWGTDSDKRKTIELVPDFRRELTGHMVSRCLCMACVLLLL